MAFDVDLRGYLEGVERGPSPVTQAARRVVDEHELRAHLLSRLRQVQGTEGLVLYLHARWTPRIAALARFVERLPAQVASTDPAGALSFACNALDQGLGMLASTVPLVDRLELARVMGDFDRGGGQLEAYALEVHLTSRTSANVPTELTALGRAFLRLRGKDAIRWLLTLEILQNQGDWDRWRVSETLLHNSLKPGGIRKSLDVEGDETFAFSDEMVAHAAALGVVQGFVNDPDDEPHEYFVHGSMHDVVQAVLERGPWHTAIAALLEDQRAAVVTSPTASATDAVLEQSRMITHELRNALVPARHHIDSILAVVTSEPAVVSRARAARRGIVRVLDFVDQMVTMAEVIKEPATASDVAALAQEAAARSDGGEAVEISASAHAVRIATPRSRFVVALANLVRNALQAASPPPPVRVSAQRFGGSVQIAVDDGGPGVALNDRTHVFDDGFTTRPGGSGFGLAYVKRLVEGDLRGRVWCEDSDLGGARFVIEVPSAETEP